jgi:hypothetical protein
MRDDALAVPLRHRLAGERQNGSQDTQQHGG